MALYSEDRLAGDGSVPNARLDKTILSGGRLLPSMEGDSLDTLHTADLVLCDSKAVPFGER